MRCLLILVFWTTVIKNIAAQDICVPVGDDNGFLLLENLYVNGAIYDNHTGVVSTLTVAGITGISVTPNEYLQASAPNENEEIIISVTDEFVNFEKNTNSGPDASWQLEIGLICGTATLALTFQQPIIDLNTFTPTFDQETYTFQLPMPFPSNLEITQLGIQIIATDYDSTNTRVTFEIDSDDLDIEWGGTTDAQNKNHAATLIATRPLEFTTTQSFTITVTDIASEPKSSTATILIEVDEDNSIAPTPAFVSAYHELEYAADASVPMPITNLNPGDECSLGGDYASYFNCRIEADEGVVYIELTDTLSDEDLELSGYRVLVVEVAASETRVTRSVVILRLPELIITTTACPTETTVTTTPCEVCEVCTTTVLECTTTEAIPCETCEICPSTTPAPECPELDCSECPTTPGEECTTIPAEECPELDCSECPTTPGEVCTTTPAEDFDCSTCPTTPAEECPELDCSECPTTPGEECTTTPAEECPFDCATCPTTPPEECTTTPSEECPFDCATCPTTPGEECTTTPAEECPFDCATCPTTPPEECTTTPSEDLDCSECPPTPCEECTTTAPEECPFDCATCPTEPPEECTTTPSEECPFDCATCPTEPPEECTTTPSEECPFDCATCPTEPPEECTTAPSEECPFDCATCPTEPPEECTTTPSEECPYCPFDCATCPTEPPEECTTTPSEEGPFDCATCPTEPPEECTTTPSEECPYCPFDCATCPTEPPEECTTTPSEECPYCPFDCATCPTEPPEECTTTPSEECPFDCATCPTESPEECTTTPSEECPYDCASCPTVPPEECTTTPSEDCENTPLDCSSCTTEICEDYVCTGTCPTIDCSVCITTPAPIEAAITFVQDNFRFSLSANDDMSQHYLPLSATSTIDENIRYESDDLPSQLNLDETNGMLTNNAPLPALVYEFLVTATGETSEASTTATVTINVAAVEICDDGGIVVGYSLVVTSIPENAARELLTSGLESEDTTYRLEISSVSPAAGEDLFEVSADGQTITCSALDRESSHFDDMDVTQYTVTINAISTEEETVSMRQYRDSIFHIPSKTSTNARASTRVDGLHYILVEDIPTDTTQTVLIVIVEDENDNPPEFSTTSLVIGYPETSLLSVIAPPYLVQVEATDADSGENAELAYYVDNSLVRIHSSTGVVYPTDGLVDEDFTFVVTASDQKGDGLPSSNSLEVQVKVLQQEHISVLTITNALLEDITEKLSEFNAIANVNIRQLHASVLPTENTRQTRIDENYFLVITAYALDDANNLVTTETLQGLLDNVAGLVVGSLPDSNNPTEPEVPIDATITFVQDNFQFFLSVNDDLSQHYLPLSATSDIDESIRYRSEDLPSQLNLDETNGMLTNNAPLPALVYEFLVTATGETSEASATATVTINVAAVELCDDGGIVVGYSLVVTSIPENAERELLTSGLESEDTTYRLEISSVSPAAGEDLFEVSADGQTITCSALDKESSHFDDMDVTQYTVTINAISTEEETVSMRQYRDSIFHIPSKTFANARASTRADGPQCILVEDIPTNTAQTVLIVIVEDENDNQPEFSTTSLVIGYPATSLLSVIAPPYLVQVEATDADSGENAELAYYVDNSLVRIHSTTGVVYPTDGLVDADFTFVVTARDQNGDGLLSRNSLQVQVKVLEQEHISVLTITNALLEDITEKLLELNAIANVNIRQLHASVLPTENTRQARAGESYFLVITAYALDGANNLVSTDTLQGLLDNVAGLAVGSLPDSNIPNEPGVTDPTEPDDPDGSSGNTGLIAAICVLSVLLVLILIGFFAFWYFRLRKSKPYKHMEEEDRASTTPPQFKKNVAMGRSSSKLSHIGHDIDKPERRVTGILISSPVMAAKDTPLESPPKERRKSVGFNPNVEQINIVTSRENDDSAESSKL